MKFDGTDDVITTSADSTLATKTYSFWAKSTDTGGNVIFDHGGAFSGALQFHYGNSHILWMNGGYVFWPKTPESSDGNWHHHLFVVNTVYANSKWYQDGVLQAQTSNSAHGASSTSYSTGIRIGRGGSAYFDGSLDEFAIFNGDQSALADELYNNGRPTNLSSYSTLDHWFRMGEGKLGSKSDGESNLLFDQGPNGGVGSELITNGDFSSSSGWTLDSNASVSGGKLVLASSSGISYQTLDLDDGAAYEVTFTIENLTSGTVKPYLNGTNGTVRNANGTYKEIVLAGSSNTLVGINPSGTMHIDNFSVKKLTNVGTINGARIQADGGSELIVNGTFDSNVTSWPASSSGTVTWSNGTAITGAVGTDDRGGMSQTFTTVNGATYQLTFDVISRTSTKWEVYRQSSGGPGTIIEGTDLGSHSTFFTAAATSTELAFYAKQAGTSDGTVAWDNISVKEVTESVPKQTQNLPSGASKKSLSFDGTDDFATIPYQLPTTTFTVSQWIRINEDSLTSAAVYIWDSRDASYTNANIFLPVKHSATEYKLRWWNSGTYRINDSTIYPIGVWQHVVLVKDGTTGTMYVDGVKLTEGLSFSNTTNGAAITVGRRYAATFQYAEVDIDEFAVWDTALDGDAVKALYNAGLPTPVITNTGAYDIYRDNLKAYYKMGDASDPAADGTSNLLFDQTSPGVGPEVVTNGDFSDNSVPDTYDGSSAVNLVGWTSGGATFTADAHFVITDGKCRLISDGTNTVINSGTTVAGRTYQYSIDLLDVTSGGLTLIGGGVVLESNATSPGTYTGFYTAASATSAISINRQSGVTDFTFDNVSVKEVNGNTGTISGATIQTEAPKAIYALAPVDNTKSLNFDGTNDHLVTQVDATAQPNNESRYYSFWCKASLTGATARQAIFSHGGFQVGAFYFNYSSSRPLLYMAPSVYQFWADTPTGAQDDGNWHHWVVKIKYNDITGCELWCDGVKQTKSDVVNSGSMNTYSSGIIFGGEPGGSKRLEGSLDEFSIHEDLTEEGIRALFNRGRPIDISKSQGAYDLSDNALHWWRMGDATSPSADGTNDIIFQGFSQTDDELIINGDFSSGDSDWTKGTGWTIANGVASCDGTNGSESTIKTELVVPNGQNNVLYGKTFQLQFDILNYSAGTLAATLEGTGGLELSGLNSDGSYTAFCTTTSTNPRLNFNASAGFVGSIDNVSLKQLRGQYIGPELVKADAYASGSWQGSNTAEFGSNFAKFTRPSSGGSTNAATSYLGGANTSITSAALTIGATYKISVDVETDDSDVAVRVYDGSAYTVATSGNGTKVLYFVPTHATNPILRTTSALDATKFIKFSNISLKEVGGAAVMTNMDSASDIQTDTPY